MANGIKTFAFAVVTMTFLSGCATLGEHQSDALEPGPESISVEVENNNWNDMRVYAVTNGVRVRLGTVPSMTRQTLRIPPAFMGTSSELRLLADPIGTRDGYLSEPVLIHPGQNLSWRLENHLALSSIFVRR